MFVALDNNNGRKITNLDPAWKDRQEVLRSMAQGNQLSCPGCRQSVLFRAGRILRPHFAHVHLADCPLAHQSSEVLEAKAQLYEWLIIKFPGQVEMDADLSIPPWRHPADVVVRRENRPPLAFWIFDGQQRLRTDLLCGAKERNIRLQIIHTQKTHQVAEGRLLLTASQRTFIAHSGDDQVAGGGHLFFFDTEARQMLIYRGLHKVHEPNVFRWNILRQGPLSSLLIRPNSGELVFPEDMEALEQWKQAREAKKRKQEARAVQKAQAIKQDDSRLWMAHVQANVAAFTTTSPLARAPADPGPPSCTMGPFKCERCGVETMDWVSAKPILGSCVCRTCLTKPKNKG